MWTWLLPPTDGQWIGVGFTIRVLGEDLCPSAKQIIFIEILISMCRWGGFQILLYLNLHVFQSDNDSWICNKIFLCVVKCKIYILLITTVIGFSYFVLHIINMLHLPFHLNNDEFFRKYWYTKFSVVTALYLTPCWPRSSCWHTPIGWRQSSPQQTQRGGRTIFYSSQS